MNIQQLHWYQNVYSNPAPVYREYLTIFRNIRKKASLADVQKFLPYTAIYNKKTQIKFVSIFLFDISMQTMSICESFIQ